MTETAPAEGIINQDRPPFSRNLTELNPSSQSYDQVQLLVPNLLAKLR